MKKFKKIKRHFKLVSILSILGMLFSCNSETNKESVIEREKKKELYTILSAAESNISFKNVLKETLTMNGLFYEYFYNGGGVAVGDLNGDDLPDIYFISCLKSNKLYLNSGSLKFKDVTETALLKGKYGFATGVTLVDINADGKLDIYICKSGKFNDPNKRRNELYINKGNDLNGIPVFEENAKKYGLDLPHFSTQASFFDYDKDGDLDLFLINHGVEIYADSSIKEYINVASEYRGERLFRNNEGSFVDVTKKSGIVNNKIGFALGLSVGDLNNDGWPDVLVGQDFSERDHMYLNQKNGTFKEVIKETTGHISNFSMGNDIADFNNDGLLDFISVDMMSEHNYDIKTSMSGMNPKRFDELVALGLHHQYMYNTLQINNGNHKNLPRFSDIAQMSNVSSTDWSWAPLFLDMDNDGFKDLFVSNGIKRDFRNSDFVNYRKKRQKEVLKLKKKGEKFDQKGYVRDIMDKMPGRKRTNYFYKNNGDLTFSKKSLNGKMNAGINSNGAAYADLDNDGDLDLVVNNSDDVSFVYKNNTTENGLGNYLNIKLKGSSKNTNGIGARLIAIQKNKKQVLEQYLTRGFQSSVSEILHFGFGKETRLDTLKIIWPDGKTQILKNIKTNQLLTLDSRDAILPSFIDTLGQNPRLFVDRTDQFKIKHKHVENDFDDFKRESLLPHKMSNFGPALAVGDLNSDGLDDYYVGGAKGFGGEMYFQKTDQTFEKSGDEVWKTDSGSEDISAEVFDADSDGDLDLYVVSGGNEYESSSKGLQDRLYLNDGLGNFKKSRTALPKMLSSGSVVKPHDFDGDGDLDLFIGGRLIPGKYPFPAQSYLLENRSKNGNVVFKDVTETKAPEFKSLGLITDAEWVDVTGDKKKDLVLVGEWTPVFIFKNNGTSFKNITDVSGLDAATGWWYSVSAADMDADGDMDLVVGNLGKNYKYKASYDAPFGVYSKDFDRNGTLDIVLSYYDMGKKYPLRGRSCSSGQMPFIKEKFPTYREFGAATLDDVYGRELERALNYKVNTFATSYIENLGSGTFKIKDLPNEAQFSSVNDIQLDDFNGDGFKDIVLVGNLFASEIETPRNDAGFGMLFIGNSKGDFKGVSAVDSGLYTAGDVKGMKSIQLGSGISKKKGLLVAKNNGFIQLIGLQ